GWRRFAEQTGSPLNPDDKLEVDRMLVAHGQRTTAPLELFKLEEQRVGSEFTPRIEKTRVQFAVARSAWLQSQAANGPGIAGQVAAAQGALNEAEGEYTKAAAELYRNETRPLRAGSWGLPVLMLALFG